MTYLGEKKRKIQKMRKAIFKKRAHFKMTCLRGKVIENKEVLCQDRLVIVIECRDSLFQSLKNYPFSVSIRLIIKENFKSKRDFLAT